MRAYCRRVGIAENGRPYCVHGPMVFSSNWRCPLSVQASKRRYAASEKGREMKKRRNACLVRISAGGIRFYLGIAPSAEAAARLRHKIRTEAPHHGTAHQ